MTINSTTLNAYFEIVIDYRYYFTTRTTINTTITESFTPVLEKIIVGLDAGLVGAMATPSVPCGYCPRRKAASTLAQATPEIFST